VIEPVMRKEPKSHQPGRGRTGPGRRPVRVAVACLAAATALGCSTVGPDYKRPPVPIPAAWSSELADAADVANTSWWEAFRDPDLNELIRMALEANKDLRIALFRIDQFDARLQISNSAGKPQAGYSASVEYKRKSQEQLNELAISGNPSYNAFNVGLNVSWEIDLWGRIKRANEAALAELMSTQAAQRGVMLTVVCGVATSYVQLLGLDRELAIARQTLKNRQTTLDVTIAKQKGGSATQLTVERARAAVEEASSGIPEIERRIASTEFALSSLVGRNPGPIKRRAIDELAMPTIPQGVPSDLLTRRPDVMAAEQSLVASNARVGVAMGEYYPTISLTGALGLGSDQLRWLLARDARTGEMARGLVGTLYSAGRIEGDVREAEAVQRQMAERYLQSVQTGLQEVETALVSRAKTGEQVVALGRQVKSLQEATRLTQLRFEAGESTVLDVLDAERQVFAAQGQQAQGWREQFAALVSVYKAMGGGWMVEQNKLRAAKAAAPAASVANGTPTALPN
jgi:multidrug efflux system outer membrane protein